MDEHSEEAGSESFAPQRAAEGSDELQQAPSKRRRLSRRARITALATAGAIVASAGAASWAVYNKPELRLVRAIKSTAGQKNMDVTLSFQTSADFLRVMNQGKPLLDVSKSPFVGIKSDEDVAKALGNVHLHIRSSGTDIKNPSMMWAVQYGTSDVLALTLTDRRLYLSTQAKNLPTEDPALYTAAQFSQVFASLKTPLGPEYAAFINQGQRDVLSKLVNFADGQTLFVSLAPGSSLGKWWDANVASPSTSNKASVAVVQKKISALSLRVRNQLRDVAKVKDLPNDAVGDRMRITIDVAKLLKLNKASIVDIVESISNLGGSASSADRGQATKEIDAWLAKPTIASFTTDVWVKAGRFHRFEFDMSNLMADSLPSRPKVTPRGAVVRMDMDDIAVTAPSDAVEFTQTDVSNAGRLLGGLFLGGLMSGLGGVGL